MTKQVLNRTEEAFFNKLTQACGSEYHVQFQVAVSQLINARSTQVVDFLVTQKNTYPLVVIEVDGPHHDKPEQKSKDVYKDKRIVRSGVPVVRYSVKNLPSEAELLLLVTRCAGDRASMIAETKQRIESVENELAELLEDAQIPEESTDPSPFSKSPSPGESPKSSGMSWMLKSALGIMALLLIKSYFSTGQKPEPHLDNRPVVLHPRVERQPLAAAIRVEAKTTLPVNSIKPSPPPTLTPSPPNCEEVSAPHGKSLVSSASEIRNNEITAYWKAINNSGQTVAIVIGQDNKYVAVAFLGPNQKYESRIPGSKLQFFIHHTVKTCVKWDSLFSPIYSYIPDLQVPFKDRDKKKQIDMYRDAIFQTIIEPTPNGVSSGTTLVGYADKR